MNCEILCIEFLLNVELFLILIEILFYFEILLLHTLLFFLLFFYGNKIFFIHFFLLNSYRVRGSFLIFVFIFCFYFSCMDLLIEKWIKRFQIKNMKTNLKEKRFSSENYWKCLYFSTNLCNQKLNQVLVRILS